MDFYGPAVNRAARVEGQAEGGQFLICETTYLHTLAENGSAQVWLMLSRARLLGFLRVNIISGFKNTVVRGTHFKQR